MKSLWSGLIIVTGLSFYNPKFIMVFSVIIAIDLIIGSRKNSIKILRCLSNKQQLLSLKRANADIEQFIKVCYLNIDKHNKDNHTD